MCNLTIKIYRDLIRYLDRYLIILEIKRRIKLNLYLAEKEISYIRDIINKVNTIEYLIEN